MPKSLYNSKMKAKALILFITIALLLAACERQTPQDTIQIGSILILTGDGASWGIATKNGMEMALDKINSEGGVLGKKLQVSYEDDHYDKNAAISAFQKLTDAQDINLIIGTTWSNTGVPLIQLADQKKAVMISASLGVKEFNEGSKYLFNIWPHDYLLSEGLADFVFNKGYKKVAIFGAPEVWVKAQTDGFKNKFESLGGQVVLMLEPNPDDKNLQTEALKIKGNKEVEALVMTNTITTDVLARRMKELGVDLTKFSAVLDNNVIQASQGALDGTIFLTSLTPSNEFESAYKARYNQELDVGADTGYDAVMLLAQAIKATGSTDSDKIADYLGSLREYDGVSGHLTFDGKGGVTKPFVVKEVKNGAAVTLG